METQSCPTFHGTASSFSQFRRMLYVNISYSTALSRAFITKICEILQRLFLHLLDGHVIFVFKSFYVVY